MSVDKQVTEHVAEHIIKQVENIENIKNNTSINPPENTETSSNVQNFSSSSNSILDGVVKKMFEKKKQGASLEEIKQYLTESSMKPGVIDAIMTLIK